MSDERYEINHEGKVVAAESALCNNLSTTLINLFSQYNWTAEISQTEGALRIMRLVNPSGETRFLNVYACTVRNEARNAYEKKAQLGGLDPTKKPRDNTIILGVYVFNSNDSIEDAIFVGYPIDNNIRYTTNPSLRGVRTDGILLKAKHNGFVFDKEHNTAAFRAEFIFYYINNFCELHYGEKSNNDAVMNSTESGDDGYNILLYGVPGCGKSYTIKTKYCNDEKYIERTVFHPDYTYADFIGQILPRIEGDNISYEFKPGPFTRILKKAYDNPETDYYLIIEEINRGNAPAIFGDIFQLLDRDKNGVSEFGISNSDIAREIFKTPEMSEAELKILDDKQIKIPANLILLATMNTADQNVFTLDTAFKRRWNMKSIKNEIQNCEHANTCICDTEVTWFQFATEINDYIIEDNEGNLSSEDNRLGAWFVKENELTDQKAFAEKVLMYLWNDAFKFSRDKVFKSEYKTLEDLIDGFKSNRFKVFTDKFSFSNEGQKNINTESDEISIESNDGE